MYKPTTLPQIERPSVSGIHFSDALITVLSGELYFSIGKEDEDILSTTPLQLARYAIEHGDFYDAVAGGYYFSQLMKGVAGGLGIDLKVTPDRTNPQFLVPTLLGLGTARIDRVEVLLAGFPEQYEHITLNGNRCYIDEPIGQREARLDLDRAFGSIPSVLSPGRVADLRESGKL